MEQIELSRPDIRAVIHSGRAEQSPLAASFIKKVMYQFDIEIVACYAESYESMVIPKTTQKHGLFRKPTSARLPEHPEFERSLFVTVYVKETFSKCNNLIMDGMKLQIMSLFLQTLEEFHVSVPYPRLLTLEEQQAYGFVGQHPDQRDSSRIIHPNEVPMQKNVLSVESFVGLALWHIYSVAAEQFKDICGNKKITRQSGCSATGTKNKNRKHFGCVFRFGGNWKNF